MTRTEAAVEAEVRVVPTTQPARALTLHPKVAAGQIGGWISVLVLYALHRYAHEDLPVEVGAAVTGLIVFLCSWATPSD